MPCSVVLGSVFEDHMCAEVLRIMRVLMRFSICRCEDLLQGPRFKSSVSLMKDFMHL